MDVPDILYKDSNAGSKSTVMWEKSNHNPVKNEAVYFESLPSYDAFFTDIFLKNQLCMLGSNTTDAWNSRKLWVTNNGYPNFEFLKQNFGEVNAPVTNCHTKECLEMSVADFLDYWRTYKADGHPASRECLYLKDWHFTRDFPSFCAYTPPSLLCSDWLNEFWDVRRDEGLKGDDYRFVYLGPKNTWTPFHSDVLRSYSWSANICGRKKWIFFPPGEEDKLRDKYGQLVADLTDPALADSTRYPHAKGVLAAKSITVIQNPGQIVFVPSGWHHQVFNLEDTISINHNWINGASVHLTWAFLQSQLAKVKDEIADCAGMDGFHTQCQKILKADIGMDYLEFCHLLVTIAGHRLCALEILCRNIRQEMGTDCSNPSRKNPDEGYVLCLWKAALYNSTTLGEDAATAKPDIQRVLISQRNIHENNPSTENSSSSCLEFLSLKHNSGNCKNKGDFDNGKDKGDKDNGCVNVASGDNGAASSKVVLAGLTWCATSELTDNNCDRNEDNDDAMCIHGDNSYSTANANCKVLQTSTTNSLTSSELLKLKDNNCDNDDNADHTGTESSDNIIDDDDDIGHDNADHHGGCPHWAHCGPGLAVFDLRRILAVLEDVTHQPEWTASRGEGEGVVEGEGEGVEAMVEGGWEEFALRIQNCLDEVSKCISTV